MIVFTPLQAQELARLCFFQRVRQFVREQSRHPAFVAAINDPELTHRLWSSHWPRLRERTEHDAALTLCFALACHCLGLDELQALAQVGRVPEQEQAMKLFLSRRGLLRFSAFDCPELTQPAATH